MQRRIFLASLTTLALANGSLTAALSFARPCPHPQQRLRKPKLQPRHFQRLQSTPIMPGGRRR